LVAYKKSTCISLWKYYKKLRKLLIKTAKNTFTTSLEWNKTKKKQF